MSGQSEVSQRLLTALSCTCSTEQYRMSRVSRVIREETRTGPKLGSLPSGQRIGRIDSELLYVGFSVLMVRLSDYPDLTR